MDLMVETIPAGNNGTNKNRREETTPPPQGDLLNDDVTDRVERVCHIHPMP
jgi:hypothetical protein